MKIEEYSKEPFDLHLFVLLLIKKIWIILLGGILGGILFGGIYYLNNVTFGPGDIYEMVSESYLEYAYDENGEQYVIFNQVTWESMIYSDDFIFPIVLETGLEAEQIKESISATLLSDTRILTTTVEGLDKEVVEQINSALLKSLQDFGENQRELVQIRSMLEPDSASIQKQDIRVLNATILGLTIGILLSFFAVILYLIWDDRIHYPGIFESRYKTSVIGVYGTEFYNQNCAYFTEKEKEYVAVILDGSEPERLEFGRNSFKKIIANPFMKPENLKYLDYDNYEQEYILFVNANSHNSNLIRETLELFEEYDCKIYAAVLTDVDEKLLKMYYFPGKRWINKHLK